MNNNKTLFLFTHSNQIDWYTVFANAFKECGENFRTVVFVHGKEDAERARKYECYDIVINLIDGFIFQKNVSKCETKVNPEIIYLEKKISKSFLWEDLKIDRWARISPSQQVIQYMNYSTNILLEAYRNFKPEAALGEYTMGIYRYAHHLFSADGKLMFYPITTRYFNRLYFETDLDWIWHDCITMYHKFLDEGIPDNVANAVKPILSKITGKQKAKPIYTIHEEQSPTGYTNLKRLSLKDYFKRIRRALYGQRPNANNIRDSFFEFGVRKKLQRMLIERLNHWSYNKIVVNKVPSDIRYATYFLHYQPEYTSDSLGKFYQDQRRLIAIIAASLPADVSLIVKEHPTMIGLREANYYLEILKSPNVILVNHEIDSSNLIHGGELVFTIVGTPALEAMFIGKPAIMFAEYAFARTNTISICKDVSKLKSLILKKISEDHDLKNVEKHSLALLAAKYATSRPGQIPIAEELIPRFMGDKYQHEIIKASFKEELFHRGIIK